LPHGLVEAFRSTLEEAAHADVLIHVADASDPKVDTHITTTLQVLEEIGAGTIPRILVLNKIDLTSAEIVNDFLVRYPESIAISAKSSQGLDALVRALQELLSREMRVLSLRIPHKDYHLVSLVMREGMVLDEKSDDEATYLRCRVPEKIEWKIKAYIMKEASTEAHILR
jgi:GTP-binding protein HflX